jgi:hypothetical protein
MLHSIDTSGIPAECENLAEQLVGRTAMLVGTPATGKTDTVRFFL